MSDDYQFMWSHGALRQRKLRSMGEGQNLVALPTVSENSLAAGVCGVAILPGNDCWLRDGCNEWVMVCSGTRAIEFFGLTSLGVLSSSADYSADV